MGAVDTLEKVPEKRKIFQDYVIRAEQSFIWAAFAPATNVAPDSDDVIDGRKAKRIFIEFDTTPAGNVSDNVDIGIIKNPGINDSNRIFNLLMNLADSQIDGFLLNGGFQFKLRANNNHASDDAAPQAKVHLLE